MLSVRYLDAQRIGHVAKYLKRLHEKNMAELGRGGDTVGIHH